MANPLDAALASYLPEKKGRLYAYPDLHDHLWTLVENDLLHIIQEPVNKDTQMHPLVRWQYRGGIDESLRKAFLFLNPTDSKGRSFDGPVFIGALAGSRRIYELGFGRKLDQIGAAWISAIAAPIAPNVVKTAPCQEIIFEGADLDKHGLERLPVPISTPGWDNAPYLSAGHFITRDPETGIQNVGTYRGQIKGPRRLGMNASVDFRQGIFQHWEKYKALGKPMPACVVIGCPPVISYAAGYKIPDNLDEVAVAGALVGAPINIVRARTVDVMIPAEAEYVIEGLISTEFLEPEGPFGESHGHVNLQEYNAFMEVTAVTRRKAPLFLSIISQVAPSESSTIRRAAMEPELLQFLRASGVGGILKVHMHEPLTSVLAVFVLQFKRGAPQTEVTRALYLAGGRYRFAGRWIIAVDEDIDIANCDAVFWSMAYRCQPQYDLKLMDAKEAGHGPRATRDEGRLSTVLINATLKAPTAPVALPKQHFMEDAQALWERLGLPKLTPERPWFGYDLGAWTAELERQSQMATAGDYMELGEELAGRRRGDVTMNTPVRNDPSA